MNEMTKVGYWSVLECVGVYWGKQARGLARAKKDMEGRDSEDDETDRQIRERCIVRTAATVAARRERDLVKVVSMV